MKDEDIKLAIEKLKVVGELTQINDVKVICKTLVKLLGSSAERELGFTGSAQEPKQ